MSLADHEAKGLGFHAACPAGFEPATRCLEVRFAPTADHALDVLTQDGVSRSAAIRQPVLDAASRRGRAATMRREVLRMNLGEPDGINVAEELARDRSGER